MYTFLSLRLLVLTTSFLGSHYDTVRLEIYSRYFFLENIDFLSSELLFIGQFVDCSWKEIRE